MSLAPGDLQASTDEIDAVRNAALDYIEGYVTGDAERHARAYHPECVKRRFVTDEETGIDGLVVLSPRIMADYAARTRIDDCETDVIIDAISEGIASVRVYSCRWVDFLHVVRARGEWRLFHVTWHRRPDDGDQETTTPG